ncbi:MAG: 16S rRNA (uracil(1498)-N(3))-methyltransferase [Nocardioidaceae bacterium]
MSTPVFLAETDALRGDRRETDDVVVLEGPEGRHAATVRRLRSGERVDLTDGRGLVAHCEVSESSRSGLVLRVRDRTTEPAPHPRLVVVQALPKGDRAETAVEMLTEVGADVIVPWAASRCVVQWRGERAAKSLAKWRSHAREAGKQSRRAWHPQVRELHDTADVVELLDTAALPVVLHEDAAEPLADLDVPEDGDVVLVVGPEGGISDDELAVLDPDGRHTVRLGRSVLRTSTAGVVAAAVVLSRTGRWR